MNWKKKTLLALVSATALVGVAASASAEDWSFFGFWSPQASYASHYDRDRGDNDGYYGRYYGRDYYRRNRDWNSGYYGHHRDWSSRDYTYGGGRTRYWNHDNGYLQQDRDGYRSYGRHESDDDD